MTATGKAPKTVTKPKVGAPKKIVPQTLSFVDDEMFLLFTCPGKYLLARYRNDQPVDLRPAAPSMWLSAAFTGSDGAPNVVLASRQGDTQWVGPAKPKRIKIPTA